MTSSLAWLIPVAPYRAVAIFAACLACGSAIAACGVFGHPRARAPVCAACGHGIAQTATGADAPCAECGCDLSDPSAIRSFEVRRAPRRIAAGLAVAASSMLVLLAVHVVVMLATAAPGIGANTPAAELAAMVASPAAATSERGTGVDLDCEELLFHRFDAERLRDLSGRVIPVERWPTPLATRRVTITHDRVP